MNRQATATRSKGRRRAGGHGSDLELETADGVIIRDELESLPIVIELSQHAPRSRAELVFARAAIITLIASDLFGHLPLPLGVAGAGAPITEARTRAGFGRAAPATTVG